jgi:prepilin-type N-terminal cleavage/methylation domain-containing protein
MTKHLKGFSVVELLIVVVILGLIGAGGYIIYDRTANKADKTPTAPVSSGAPAGSSQHIDDVNTNDQNAEDGIDSKHISSDQSNIQSTNGAAANIGGAYDESSF